MEGQEHTSQPSQDDGLLEAKKIILEDMGLASDKVSRINSVQAADLMIKHLESVKAAAKTEQPKTLTKDQAESLAKMNAAPAPLDQPTLSLMPEYNRYMSSNRLNRLDLNGDNDCVIFRYYDGRGFRTL